MACLYAGGASSILPDVRFGTVSLDQVTYVLLKSLIRPLFTEPVTNILIVSNTLNQTQYKSGRLTVLLE